MIKHVQKQSDTEECRVRTVSRGAWREAPDGDGERGMEEALGSRRKNTPRLDAVLCVLGLRAGEGRAGFEFSVRCRLPASRAQTGGCVWHRRLPEEGKG